MTMIKKPFSVVCGALAALVITSQASAQYFVRPMITYLDPHEGQFSSEVGFAVSAGKYLGAQQQHELSLDVGVAKTEHTGGNPFITISAEMEYLPVLAKYQYHYPLRAASIPASIYVGPAVGVTRMSFSLNERTVIPFGTSVVSGSDDQWNFTWGGSAGVLIKVARNVDIDVGFRYLEVQGADYDLGFASMEMEKTSPTFFYAGVGFRF